MKTFLFTLSLLIVHSSAFAMPDTLIRLDGSGSLYADIYQWRQVSGIPVILTDSDSAICKADITKEGKYVFELTVTNDYGSDKDSVTVTAVSTVLALDLDQERKRQRPDKPTKLKIDIAQSFNEIRLRVESPRHQQIDCIIYDVLGREIARAKMTVNTGVNYATLPRPRISGIYYLRFITYFENKTLKLII